MWTTSALHFMILSTHLFVQVYITIFYTLHENDSNIQLYHSHITKKLLVIFEYYQTPWCPHVPVASSLPCLAAMVIMSGWQHRSLDHDGLLPRADGSCPSDRWGRVTWESNMKWNKWNIFNLQMNDCQRLYLIIFPATGDFPATFNDTRGSLFA